MAEKEVSALAVNTIPPVTREYANHLVHALVEQFVTALRSRLALATEDERHWLTHRVQVIIGEVKSLMEVL